MSSVWVVMSQYSSDDDGNWDRDVVSVHSSHDGAVAAASRVPGDFADEWHEGYVQELELEP